MVVMSTMETSKETSFLGRNGAYKCKGFYFHNTSSSTDIQPITSKNSLGRCRIEIPNEDLGEFCGHLQQDLVSLVLQNIPPDSLPVLLGLNDQLDALIAKELGK